MAERSQRSVAVRNARVSALEGELTAARCAAEESQQLSQTLRVTLDKVLQESGVLTYVVGLRNELTEITEALEEQMDENDRLLQTVALKERRIAELLAHSSVGGSGTAALLRAREARAVKRGVLAAASASGGGGAAEISALPSLVSTDAAAPARPPAAPARVPSAAAPPPAARAPPPAPRSSPAAAQAKADADGSEDADYEEEEEEEEVEADEDEGIGAEEGAEAAAAAAAVSAAEAAGKERGADGGAAAASPVEPRLAMPAAAAPAAAASALTVSTRPSAPTALAAGDGDVASGAGGSSVVVTNGFDAASPRYLLKCQCTKEVAAGEVFTFPVHIAHDAVVLKWNFETSGGDIAFGVQLHDDAEEGGGGGGDLDDDEYEGTQQLVESKREDSNDVVAHGTLQLKGFDGDTVELRWDNSFSWFTAKKLTYDVELLPMTQEEDSVGASATPEAPARALGALK